MSTPYRRLRRQMPYLTPSWAGEDDDGVLELLRQRIPPVGPIRLGGPSISGEESRVPVSRLPIGPPSEQPEFGDPYSSDIPTLRRPPLHDIDRIAALGEENPLPTTESGIPLLSRPVEMPTLQRRPTVIHDGSRPTNIVFGTNDPEQQVLARRRALESYQPQRESKKSLALRTILNFVGGGIPGAAETLLGQGGILDRRGKDEAWKRKELGGVYGQLDRTRADRRAGLQDRLLESQIAENNAQAQKTPQRPPPLFRGRIVGRDEFPDIPAGTEIRQEFDPTTGQMKDALVNGKPVVTRPSPSAAERPPLFKTVTKRDGSTRVAKSTDNGKTWQDVPELEGEPKPDEKEGERRIQSEIAAATAKAARTKAANLRSNAANLENNAQHVDVIEAEKLRAEAQQYRRQAYDADQEAEVQEGKVRAYSTPPTLTRGGNGAIEQRIRDAATAKGKDPDEAIKRYRRGDY